MLNIAYAHIKCFCCNICLMLLRLMLKFAVNACLMVLMLTLNFCCKCMFCVAQADLKIFLLRLMLKLRYECMFHVAYVHVCCEAMFNV